MSFPLPINTKGTCHISIWRNLTLRAPPMQTTISNFAAFSKKKQIRHDISWESSAGIGFSRNIIPYFFQKLGKKSQYLSSAAVVIGALRVNYFIPFGNFSSTDSLCKLFGPRSGSKLFDSLIVFDSGEKFYKKLILKVADDKKAPSMQRV